MWCSIAHCSKCSVQYDQVQKHIDCLEPQRIIAVVLYFDRESRMLQFVLTKDSFQTTCSYFIYGLDYHLIKVYPPPIPTPTPTPTNRTLHGSWKKVSVPRSIVSRFVCVQGPNTVSLVKHKVISVKKIRVSECHMLCKIRESVLESEKSRKSRSLVKKKGN